MKSKIRLFIVFKTAIFLIFFQARLSASTSILDVRYWSAPDHTRIVLDMENKAYYEVIDSSDPLSFVLEVKDAFLKNSQIQEINVNDEIIKKIYLERKGPSSNLRIRLDLIKPIRYEVFPLNSYMNKPERLVLDIYRPDLEKRLGKERKSYREYKPSSTKVIVIDAGHGGEDPGAIGPRGLREKNVNLNIAQRLNEYLNKEKGIKSFLSRSGDYFIPLDKRVKIGLELGADIFISIHSNGAFNHNARGSSVYALSFKGANDKAAKLLANRENTSDLIGGIAILASSNEELNSILVDLVQTRIINESLGLAGKVIKELSSVNSLEFSLPKQAEFAVLKGLGMVSILVEVAYITNLNEEGLLTSSSFQEEVAKAITRAVVSFTNLSSSESAMKDSVNNSNSLP